MGSNGLLTGFQAELILSLAFIYTQVPNLEEEATKRSSRSNKVAADWLILSLLVAEEKHPASQSLPLSANWILAALLNTDVLNQFVLLLKH